MTDNEAKAVRTVLQDMHDKVLEQRVKKHAGKDCSEYILTGLSPSQLTQVADFILSYKTSYTKPSNQGHIGPAMDTFYNDDDIGTFGNVD